MSPPINRRILLASRPSGMPTEACFRLSEAPPPRPADGEVLVRTLFLSVDPYMRGRMSERKSYVAPYRIGEVITGGVVGRVVESRAPGLAEGRVVLGELGWQDYSVARPEELVEVDPELAPISTALGVLGMPGMTAWFGLNEIGRPKKGETVVVSGAAGAVGSLVGQLALLAGCRVVGIAGKKRKIEYLLGELGFTAALDYDTTTDLRGELQQACPNGVDIYWDNVGGWISDKVIAELADHARIVLCGQIALYNLDKPDVGPRLQPYLLTHRALMQGFIIWDYRQRFDEARQQLARLLREGRIEFPETIVEGLEQAPRAFLGLFTGENLGKMLVKVAE